MSAKRNIGLLTLFHFFYEFKLYSPILIIYMADILDSYTQSASLISVSIVSTAVFEIPTGYFSDIMGRKKTLVIGTVFSCIFIFLYIFANRYSSFFLAAIIEGLSKAFFSGNNQALLHESIHEAKEKERYNDFFGSVNAAWQLGLGLSAIAGGIVAFFWSMHLTLTLSLIPQLLNLPVSILIKEGKASLKSHEKNFFYHLSNSAKEFAKNKKLRVLSIASMTEHSLGEAVFQLTPAFVYTLWPLWALGTANFFAHIFAAFSFFISGNIIRKTGIFRLLILGNLYDRVIYIGAILLRNAYSPALMASTSLFFGTNLICQNILLQNEFSKHKRATMGSLNSLTGSVFLGFALIVMGFLIDKWGISSTLILFQTLLFSTIFMYYYYFKITKEIPIETVQKFIKSRLQVIDLRGII